jgi:hypothetical protein
MSIKNICINDKYMWVSDYRMDPRVPVTVVGTRRNDFKLDNGWVVDQYGIAPGTKMSRGGKIISMDDAVESLILEVSIAFPKLTIQKRAIGATPMIAEIETRAMPGGEAIFTDNADECGGDVYPNGVHGAFDAWLHGKGFYLERWDETWWQPESLPTATEMEGYRKVFDAISFNPEEIPF